MPDSLSPTSPVDPLQLRISQLFALRPTLQALAITQTQFDEHPEHVLEYYAEQLIDFFCGSDSAAGSRWWQLAQLLAQRLRKVLRKKIDPISLSMLQTVLTYPDSGERTPTLEAYGVHRHNGLGLAIVGVDHTLVFTLSHGLETFVANPHADWLANAERLEHDVFEGWALCALEAVLQRIDAIDLDAVARLDQLDQQLAWVTRFCDLFLPDPQPLHASLPTWLQEAPVAGRLAYSKLLAATAGVHQKYCTKPVLDKLPQDDAAHQACDVRNKALQLRRIALEYSLQGMAGVNLDGYERLRAALRTYATHRHWHGEPMGFRRLLDESGYVVGAQHDGAGPWLVFRPGSAQVFQQVTTPPEASPAFVETSAVLPALPEDEQPEWRTDPGLMRTVALWLVYPKAWPAGEPTQATLHYKRLDASWAGARGALSALQRHRLGALAHPLRVGTLIHEGINRGLHLFNNLLIFNKDENHFHVLSHNRFNTVINLNVYEHSLAGGPPIARTVDDVWEIQGAPRFKRELDGLSVRARKAFDSARALLAQMNSAQTVQPTLLPVEIEEQFVRNARALDDAAARLKQFTQRRSIAESDELTVQLQARAVQLRIEGRQRRINSVRLSQAPTVADVHYLLEQRAACIRRLNGRVEETIDGVVDYLQEYEVLDLTDGHRPLWYAHFHYPALHSAPDQPSRAHLKRADQRRLGRVYEQAERDAGRSTQVYRGPIATPAGRQLFLSII
ncbi:hypothetical protein [Pseudomonas nabeulensis]|nr:hypothetical protein [Pseudomonas nabeulensis]